MVLAIQVAVQYYFASSLHDRVLGGDTIIMYYCTPFSVYHNQRETLGKLSKVNRVAPQTPVDPRLRMGHLQPPRNRNSRVLIFDPTSVVIFFLLVYP